MFQLFKNKMYVPQKQMSCVVPQLHQLCNFGRVYTLFPEEKHQRWVIKLSLSTKKTKTKQNPPTPGYVPWKMCCQGSIQYNFYYCSFRAFRSTETLFSYSSSKRQWAKVCSVVLRVSTMDECVMGINRFQYFSLT